MISCEQMAEMVHGMVKSGASTKEIQMVLSNWLRENSQRIKEQIRDSIQESLKYHYF